jgi:hypothetical protein
MISRLVQPGSGTAGESEIEVNETIDVETIGLDDLLDDAGAPATIDYRSVDTEGSEFDILSAFDLARRRIGAFSVEYHSTPARAELQDLLTSRGLMRRFPDLSRFDDWYLHESEV